MKFLFYFLSLISLLTLGGLPTSSCVLSMSAAQAPSEAGDRSKSTALYKDIYLTKQNDKIVFGNSLLSVVISASDGSWRELNAIGVPGNSVSTSSAGGTDFKIDDAWMVATYGCTLTGYSTSVDAASGSVSLTLVYGVKVRKPFNSVPAEWSDRAARAAGTLADSAQYEYELKSVFSLLPSTGHLGRSASVLRRTDGDVLGSISQKMQGFLFQLRDVSLGSDADQTVENVGPVVPWADIPPLEPYSKLRDKYFDLGSAPDNTFGLVALHNARLDRTLSTWMDTGGKLGYSTILAGDGHRISLLHYDQKTVWLKLGETVESEAEVIWIEPGSLQKSFEHYREMLAASMPLTRNTPEWSGKLVLLEVYPQLFPDGFKGVTRRLSFYKSVGFNTVYLMPHWRGGYSPVDLYEVDPQFGTESDLKALVRAAHGLGMRVLFDMVIHGFSQQSPIVHQHPEMLVRDSRGVIVGHSDWGSLSTDTASLAYRRYMVNLVLHDLHTYDIDGYRVDANSFKMPNWDPSLTYEPWQSAAGSGGLLTAIYDAMRKEKPATVLLSEVFGPLWYSISNLVHDDMTMGPQYLLEKMQARTFTPALYKQQIADEFDSLPEHAHRVFFTRNHDTSWFYHFNGYTPQFMAMEAVHSFVGVPEVFAGDPHHGPNPDDDPVVFDHYRQLFAMRERFPELTSGSLMLHGVEGDNDWIFTGGRKTAGNLVVFLVSFSANEETAILKIRRTAIPAAQNQNFEVTLFDPLRDEHSRNLGKISGDFLIMRIKLKPFQVLAGRLGPARSEDTQDSCWRKGGMTCIDGL